MHKYMHKTLLVLGALLSAGLAGAHAGHGPSVVHWHASDLFGLLAAVLLGAWVLRSRR